MAKSNWKSPSRPNSRAGHVFPSTDELKERYRILPEIVEKADHYIQQINTSAYRNTRLLMNQVLSRNPHTNQFLENLLFEKPPHAPSGIKVAWNILLYYLQNLSRFALFILTFASERILFRTSFKPPAAATSPQYLIDTFVLVEKLLEEKQFKDYYLGGLYPVLDKCNKSYWLLPRLYGRVSPCSIRKISAILQQTKHPVATEFALLSWSDLLRVLHFILLYPLDVVKLARRLPQEETIDRIFQAELLETLPQVNFPLYVRYLMGRRIGQFAPKDVTLLSWNENQAIDKTLYKGLRETVPTARIWGCQFFIGYPPLINAQVALSEKPFGVTPDCVLVNGPAYLKPSGVIEYRKGVSMRYPGVFTHSSQPQNKQNTVLFLCYLRCLNRELIELTSSIPRFRDQALIVRAHPAEMKLHYPCLPKLWQWSDIDRCDLLDKASMVITSESSVALEAAALGTSVIIVASQESFTCNPMLATGQGEIWDIAFNAAEIDEAYKRLLSFRSRNPNHLKELSQIYKDQCFIEPTEENIVQAFRLKE